MWKRPGDTGRYQLDYILIKHRYCNSVKNSRTYPGADANIDHNLVMAKVKLWLKRLSGSRTVRKWCLKDLSGKGRLYNEALKKELDKTYDVERASVESEWTRI